MKKISILFFISFLTIISCGKIEDSSLVIKDNLAYQEGSEEFFSGTTQLIFNNIEYNLYYEEGQLFSVEPSVEMSSLEYWKKLDAEYLKLNNNLVYFANQKIPFSGNAIVVTSSLPSDTLYTSTYKHGLLLEEEFKNSLRTGGIDQNIGYGDAITVKSLEKTNPMADSLMCERYYINENAIWLYRYKSPIMGEKFMKHKDSLYKEPDDGGKYPGKMIAYQVHNWSQHVGGGEYRSRRTTLWKAVCDERDGIFYGVIAKGGVVAGQKHGEWIYNNEIDGALYLKEHWFYGKKVSSEKLGQSSEEKAEAERKKAESKKAEAERKKTESKKAEAERKKAEAKKTKAVFNNNIKRHLLIQFINAYYQLSYTPEISDKELHNKLLGFFNGNQAKSANAPGWDQFRLNEDRKAAGISAKRYKEIKKDLNEHNYGDIIENHLYRTKAGQALWMKLNFPYILNK